ncbi:tetratricopeptide repeat protein [Pseudomonas shirazensis]
MDNQTILLIETIGKQWKLLLVLFFIIVFTIKWKTIWNMCANFTQIKVKRGDNEFELHRNDKSEPKEQIEQKKPELDGEKTEESIIAVHKEETVTSTEENIYKEALLQRNFTNINSLFEKTIQEEKDLSIINEKRVNNYYLRYIYGDTTAVDEFEKYLVGVTDDEQKSLALYYLGLIFKDTNSNRSIDLFIESLALTKIDSQRVSNITKLSSIYLDNNEFDKTLELLIKSLNEITENKSKLHIYKSIAEVYKKTENKLFESIANQKALELDPNNTTYLFETAYSYSDEKNKLRDIGLLIYKRLIEFNPKDSGAFNNIGVAYQNLNLGFKSVKYYKKSFDLKNSLAAANLAYLLIDKGFEEESMKFLEGANKFEEPHQNIFSATSHLKNKIAEESKSEQKILALANKKFMFFSTLGDALFSSKKIELNILNWSLNKNPCVLTIDLDKITFSWNIGEEKHKITGKITNRGIFATYDKPKLNIYSYSEHTKFTYENLESFGYFSTEKEIKFLSQTNEEIVELTFLRD